MDETRIAGYFDYAVVAEWLRRLTRNQIPSGSVGSNPTSCECKSFFIERLIFYPVSLVLLLTCNECTRPH